MRRAYVFDFEESSQTIVMAVVYGSAYVTEPRESCGTQIAHWVIDKVILIIMLYLWAWNTVIKSIIDKLQPRLVVISLAHLEIRLVLGCIILYCAYNSVSGIVLVYRYGVARNIDYFVEISVGIVRIFVLCCFLHDQLREHACPQQVSPGRLLNALWHWVTVC